MAYLRGFRLQKKYIAFFAVVPLLSLTGLIQAECPVCEGTGYVSGAPGMENVVIIKTESTQKYASRDMSMCDLYVMYLYDVILSVVNKGEDDTWGYVRLSLVDQVRGEVIDRQYVILRIPGNTSLDVSYTIWFQSEDDTVMYLTKVDAVPVIDEVEDITCNGSGKLPLNSWLVANGLKDNFKELGREQVYYQPPPILDPDEQW